MKDHALSKITYPILPLRDIVIFPHMIAPLFVGRLKSIAALESVMDQNKEIILITQKKSSVEEIKNISINFFRNILKHKRNKLAKTYLLN